MSDEEIEQTIAAIRAMLDVRADDAAKVIEGKAFAVSLISSALRCTALRPHCVSSHRDHASGPPDLATISNAAQRLSSTARYGISS
jgi:hypothetical protein